MKKLKIYAIVLLVLFGFSFSLFLPARSVYVSENVYSYELTSLKDAIYNEIVQLINIEKGKTKEAGSEAERKTAEYIDLKMRELSNFIPNGKDGSFTSFEFISRDKTLKISQNVIFLKDNPNTDKKVILSAHYDTYCKEENEVTDGVNSNLAGVALLLNLAKELNNTEMNFDIEIIFFGAGEEKMAGSYSYTLCLTDEIKENILCNINFDNLIAGDYLNVYSQSNKIIEYIRNNSQRNEIIVKKPVLALSITEDYDNTFDRLYTHIGDWSDNAFFENSGINVVYFFKGNCSDIGGLGNTESTNSKNITNTSKDNLKDLESYYGEMYLDSILDVYKITMLALTDSDFVDLMSTKTHRLNMYVAQWISLFIIGVMLVLLYFGYRVFFIKSFAVAHEKANSKGSMEEFFNKFNKAIGDIELDDEFMEENIEETFENKVKKQLDTNNIIERGNEASHKKSKEKKEPNSVKSKENNQKNPNKNKKENNLDKKDNDKID